MATITAAPPACAPCPLCARPRGQSHWLGCMGAARANREIATAAASALPPRHGKRGAEPFHQGTELGEAGGNGARVVNRDGAVGAKPQGEKGHGNAVVKVSSDCPTAAHA